jgi:hypothetical protein
LLHPSAEIQLADNNTGNDCNHATDSEKAIPHGFVLFLGFFLFSHLRQLVLETKYSHTHQKYERDDGESKAGIIVTTSERHKTEYKAEDQPWDDKVYQYRASV